MLITPKVIDRSVLVEHVGSNSSALNGIPLRRGDKRQAAHDDIIEVLECSHFFRIEFTPKRKAFCVSSNSESREEQTPTDIEESASSTPTMNGSLDHFLKDSLLKSKGSWKSVADKRMLVFTSEECESRVKVFLIPNLRGRQTYSA